MVYHVYHQVKTTFPFFNNSASPPGLAAARLCASLYSPRFALKENATAPPFFGGAVAGGKGETRWRPIGR